MICASSFLVVDLRIATLHVYLLRSSAARTLEALFLYKEAVAHETFLQTCFVEVSCGCRSTCLHEMLPRHNSLRHKTNERIGSINNILLTMGLLTIWRLFLLLFVSKLIRAYLKERISLKEVGSGRNTVFADLHVIAADYVVDHLF